MRKLLGICILSALAWLASGPMSRVARAGNETVILLGPPWALGSAPAGTAFSDATNIILNAATEMIGYKFQAHTTSAITAVDARLTTTWTGSPATFTWAIYSDSSDAPNAVVNSSTSAAVAAPATDSAWNGAVTLGNGGTGALTVGTFYWLVIAYSAGTIDGTNYIQATHGGTYSAGRVVIRHHNGTNWTTTGGVTGEACFALTHADGTYSGYGLGAVRTTSTSGPTIYTESGSTRTQGIRIVAGAQLKIKGIYYRLVKVNSPNALVWTVYQGDTSTGVTLSRAAASLATTTQYIDYFPSPVFTSKRSNTFIMATNTNATSTNNYNFPTWTAASTAYLDTLKVGGVDYVYSTALSTGPQTDCTVDTDEVPQLFAVIEHMTNDLNAPAGGGIIAALKGTLKGPHSEDRLWLGE